MQQLIRRAEKAGYKAIALTVDAPWLGRREADVKNRFSSSNYTECDALQINLFRFIRSSVSELYMLLSKIVCSISSGAQYLNYEFCYVLHSRFTLPQNVVVKSFEGLDLGNTVKVV